MTTAPTRVAFENFAPNWVLSQENRTMGTVEILINPNMVVEIHKTENPREQLSLMATCLRAMEEEEEPYQVCGFFCSALMCHFPELEPVVLDTFANLGMTVTLIMTNAEREATGMSIQPPVTRPLGLTFLAQLIFIPFKNVNSDSYGPLMTRITQSCASMVGVPSTTPLTICTSLEKAKIVRSVLRSRYHLRKTMVEFIMPSATRSAEETRLFAYIRDKLAWTEMGPLVFVHEILVRTHSPVLNQLSVQREVNNLSHALNKVCGNRHPQFFRIFAHPSEVVVIGRARFPTLLAVAHKINADLAPPNVNRFLAVSNTNNYAVNQLVRLHQAYITNRRVATTYLHYAPEDEDYCTFRNTVGNA